MTNTAFAFLNFPGGSEWIWIFLIFLILFGATALPRLFRSLGKSVHEFKKASEGLDKEMEKAAEDEETKKKADTSAGAKPPTQADE